MKKSLLNRVVLFFILFPLCSCTPSSLEDCQQESKKICRTIVEELKSVQTREDLSKKEPKLTTLFNELVDLLILAQEHQPTQSMECTPFFNPYDEPLLLQMKRMYQIEGGREIIERAQKEALILLDAKTNRNRCQAH